MRHPVVTLVTPIGLLFFSCILMLFIYAYLLLYVKDVGCFILPVCWGFGLKEHFVSLN